MKTTSHYTQIALAAGALLVALSGCNKQATDTNVGGTPTAATTVAPDAGANSAAASAANDAASHTVGNNEAAPAVTPGTSGGTSEANGHNTNTGTGVGTTHTGAAGGPDQGAGSVTPPDKTK